MNGIIYCATITIIIINTASDEEYDSNDWDTYMIKSKNCVDSDIEKKYDYAQKLFAEGKYLEAKSAFYKLRYFSDTAEMAIKCSERIYSIAKNLFHKMKYEEARKLFKELGNFSDSVQMVAKCTKCINQIKYDKAIELLNKKEYGQAKTILLEIINYKDCCALLKKLDLDVFSVDNGVVKFGNYEQNISKTLEWLREPIEWLVLKVVGNRVLLLSKYCLDNQLYNDKYGPITWADCKLRKWLNSTFLNNAFNLSEQAKIVNSHVLNSYNSEYSTNGGMDTEDKIFLLSADEAKTLFANDDARIAKCTMYYKATLWYGSEKAREQELSADKIKEWTQEDYWKSWYWLRSPGRYDNYASAVYSSGFICDFRADDADDDIHYCYGVRPALWLKLD